MRAIKLFLISFCFLGCNADSGVMENFKTDDAQRVLILELLTKLDNGNIQSAKEMIASKDLDIDQFDREGRSLLIAAMLAENYSLVEKLLRLGANPNSVHKNSDKTAMGWAASYKDTSYLKLLIKYNGDVNLYNPNEGHFPYPVYDAIGARTKHNLTTLLEEGTKLDVIGETERSPLMFAITGGNWEMVYMLLEADADIFFKNSWGETSVPLIEKNGLGTLGEPNEWRKKVVEFYSEKGVLLNLRIPLVR